MTMGMSTLEIAIIKGIVIVESVAAESVKLSKT
jgi:hypothetical protein